MSSYFEKMNSELTIPATYDVDLDAFMNPNSGSVQDSFGDTTTNVQQLIHAAK
ncbi:hypothetical protein HPULCUR_009602 [Helicostylum pulchrum]|uniref:Uncharacterized protein n=1 Tax=Helicostylum pulchrum TaxID=562976 RepID=A0ABP9YAX6_9FUNG